MEKPELGAVQARFADLVWAHAPLPSGELVKLCRTDLGWSKSTTYTVLRKLCEKGLFRNQNGTVSPLLSREEYYATRGERFVEGGFYGSLPAFVAAFLSRKTVTEPEAEEIRRMIDAYLREEQT